MGLAQRSQPPGMSEQPPTAPTARVEVCNFSSVRNKNVVTKCAGGIGGSLAVIASHCFCGTRPGKHTQNSGKSPFSMGYIHCKGAIFSIAMLVITRGYLYCRGILCPTLGVFFSRSDPVVRITVDGLLDMLLLPVGRPGPADFDAGWPHCSYQIRVLWCVIVMFCLYIQCYISLYISLMLCYVMLWTAYFLKVGIVQLSHVGRISASPQRFSSWRSAWVVTPASSRVYGIYIYIYICGRDLLV